MTYFEAKKVLEKVAYFVKTYNTPIALTSYEIEALDKAILALGIRFDEKENN